MPSFKLNLALIRDCPPLLTLKAALETLGRPADKDHGVLVVHDIVEDHIEFGLFQTKTVKSQVVDKTTGEVLRPESTRDVLFEAATRRPGAGDLGVLEVYTGSATSHETVGEFFAVLELADQNPEIEAIPLDIMDTIARLREDSDTKQFALVSAKVKNYKDAADETLVGTYSVNFTKEVSPANAAAFLAEHHDAVESVKVKLRRKEIDKPITITLRSSAFFTFSCEEDAEDKVRSLCRVLAGVAKKQPLTDIADRITAAADERAKRRAPAEVPKPAKAA